MNRSLIVCEASLLGCVFLSFASVTVLLGAEVHLPTAPTQALSAPGMREALKEGVQEIGTELGIGKSSNDNVILKPTIDYEHRQNAAAVQKLETLRQLRGGTNYWVEVANLYREILTTDASRTIKRDVKRLALLQLAAISENNKQFGVAQQLLAEYVERYPEDIIIPEIFLRQAYIYRELGSFEVAIGKLYSVMRAALNISNENLGYYQRVVLTAQSEIAETYYLQGNYPKAAEFYSVLLNNKDQEELNVPVVKVKLIRSLARSKDYSSVIKHSAEFLKDYPLSEFQAEMRYLLASSHKTLGHPQDALRELLLLLEAVDVTDEKTRAKWKTWKMLAGNEIGNDLFLQGDFPSALQVYNGLVQLDDALSWKLPILYQIGLCYEKDEQPVKAVDTYREILKSAPKGDSKLSPGLQMVIDMAAFREEILAWKLSLEKTASVIPPTVATATN